MTPATLKVTSAGQISLPAELRRRWGVRQVRLIDHGDHVEIRPLPDDVFGRLRGRHADTGIDTEALRREARAEDDEADARRSGR
jgi:AbrB family looped-hinge helix DNA binding protein